MPALAPAVAVEKPEMSQAQPTIEGREAEEPSQPQAPKEEQGQDRVHEAQQDQIKEHHEEPSKEGQQEPTEQQTETKEHRKEQRQDHTEEQQEVQQEVQQDEQREQEHPDVVYEPLQVDHNDPFDDGASDADSAYESQAGSSRTGSVTSSITDYVYENGRRYHAYRSGQYVLPNDEAEQERLDLQHHIWRLLLQGALYTAPVNIPAPGEPGPGEVRVLDLGCGTGIWAIDMADEFPRASVFGVDLSPIQPDWVPGNCRFHVDDYEDDWTYRDDEKFDFIHGRALSGTVADWPRFYRQVRTHLKPGGWCEMQEYDAWIFSDDDSFDRAPNTKLWVEKLDEASKMYGKQINVAWKHKQWMIDAGFEDVHERVIRIPVGPWAKDPALKELGRFEQIHMQMSAASHTPALFSRVFNWNAVEVQLLIEGVKREFRSKDLHLITSYRFVVGRSPRPPSDAL